MTHVLIVPSWYPANATDIGGSFFREQALALARHGLQVGVVAPRSLSMRKPSAWGEGSKHVSFVDDHGVPTYRQTRIEWTSPLPFIGPRQWIARGMRMVEAYIRTYGRPDLVHAHSIFNAGLLARAIEAKHGIPYVITEHSSAFVRKRFSRGKIETARPAVANAKALMAVSQSFAALLHIIFGPERPWGHMPNMIDERFLSAPLSTGSTAHGTFQFCNIGMMTPVKGQDVLIGAFARAFGDDDTVRLVIAGDGPLRPGLESQAQALGIAGAIRFAGKLEREQVRDLLATSDAFVLSSRVETFGIVVAEALAMGVPVVATRCGGPQSIVGPGDGILVAPDDEAALATAMAQMVRTRQEYMAAEIRKSCVARFSGNAVAAALEDVYTRAIGAAAAS